MEGTMKKRIDLPEVELEIVTEIETDKFGIGTYLGNFVATYMNDHVFENVKIPTLPTIH
jgi:hypothetical protein